MINSFGKEEVSSLNHDSPFLFLLWREGDQEWEDLDVVYISEKGKQRNVCELFRSKRANRSRLVNQKLNWARVASPSKIIFSCCLLTAQLTIFLAWENLIYNVYWILKVINFKSNFEVLAENLDMFSIGFEYTCFWKGHRWRFNGVK